MVPRYLRRFHILNRNPNKMRFCTETSNSSKQQKPDLSRLDRESLDRAHRESIVSDVTFKVEQDIQGKLKKFERLVAEYRTNIDESRVRGETNAAIMTNRVQTEVKSAETRMQGKYDSINKSATLAVLSLGLITLFMQFRPNSPAPSSPAPVQVQEVDPEFYQKQQELNCVNQEIVQKQQELNCVNQEIVQLRTLHDEAWPMPWHSWRTHYRNEIKKLTEKMKLLDQELAVLSAKRVPLQDSSKPPESIPRPSAVYESVCSGSLFGLFNSFA